MIENIDSQNERKKRFGKSFTERLNRLKENQKTKNQSTEFIEHLGTKMENYNDSMKHPLSRINELQSERFNEIQE